MQLSRYTTPLANVSVLTLGVAIATRVAAGWLADSGARVMSYRPRWHEPDDGTPEARFESQVSRSVASADFSVDEPYDLVICDSAGLALRAEVPPHLIESAVLIEITSPMEPAKSFSASLVWDMKLWARSGLGYLTREMDAAGNLIAPCIPLNRQASLLAGVGAATAGISALLEQDHAGGRHIQLDQLELLTIMTMQPVAFAQLENRIVGAPQAQALRMPGGTVETADGLAFVRAVDPDHWANLLRLIGELDDIAEQVEANPPILHEAVDRIDRRIRAWAKDRTSEDIADLCQAEHIPVAPVNSPAQVAADVHLNAREFFDRTTPEAPKLNPPWLAAVGGSVGQPAQPRPGRRAVRIRQGGSDLPLAGLRILDLTWAWAGPFATTLLSDLGAEVINVEWRLGASTLRRNPPFAGENGASNNTAAWWSANQRGKFSIGVNLKTAAGKQIVKALAAESDVVVENFSPGVVDRLGVGYRDLIGSNSSLVYVSMSAFGQTGPRSHYVGYGTHVYAASGAGYATSQDGRTCSQMYIAYPDPVSGLGGAFAIAAFVRNAQATGKPARVDLSELEMTAAIVLEPLLDALADEDDVAGPGLEYLVVETADGRFALLFIETKEDWRQLEKSLNAVDASSEAIRIAAARLDENELLARLSAVELPMQKIAHSGDVLDDEYLVKRGFWIQDESPEVLDSNLRIGGSLWHVDGLRTSIWRGAPLLFGDTRRVLEDLLGYESGRVDQLLDQQVIA